MNPQVQPTAPDVPVTSVAPDVTSVATPEGVDATISNESSVNWGEIANENDIPEEELASDSTLDVEVDTVVKGVPGAAIAPPVVPVTAVPTTTQLAPTVVPPVVPVASQEPPVPVAPVQSVAQPINFAEQRTALLSDLEKSYAMTEEDGVEFLRAPETVLPKIAAQLQMNVMEQTIAQLANLIPQFITTTGTQQKAYAENRETFFKEWPDLNKPEYTDTLTRIAVTYRQQNPTATKEKAIKEIGAIAAITLGIVPQNFQVPPQPSVPANNPHRPVMPGGGGRPAVAPVTNEFTQLANEWGED